MSARVEMLRNAPLFQGVPVAELEQLAALIKPVELAEAETFAVRGQQSPGLVVVDAGSLEVLLDSTPICSLSPGSLFAEESLVSDAPAPATLRAAIASRVGVLERGSVEEHLDQMPKLWEAIERAWRHRVLTARLYSIDIYRGLDARTRLELADAFEEHDVPPGTTLAEAGKPLDAFVVIREGQAELHLPEGHDPSSVALRAGEYVGDDVLLRFYPQTATVTAPYGARVLKLSKDAFHRVLAAHAGAVEEMRACLARREESIL